jgi:hypothetical protein
MLIMPLTPSLEDPELASLCGLKLSGLLLKQEANVCGDFFVWIRVCCNETMLRISQRIEI